MDKMDATLTALKKVRKVLEYHIETIEEGDTLGAEELESIKHLVSALNTGCECDDYNGFNCGCSDRKLWLNFSLKELKQNG